MLIPRGLNVSREQFGGLFLRQEAILLGHRTLAKPLQSRNFPRNFFHRGRGKKEKEKEMKFGRVGRSIIAERSRIAWLLIHRQLNVVSSVAARELSSTFYKVLSICDAWRGTRRFPLFAVNYRATGNDQRFLGRRGYSMPLHLNLSRDR